MMNLQKFGGFYPFNPNLGQKMQTQIKGVEVDAGYVAHYRVAGADAVAADDDGVHAAINASADSVVVTTTEISNPAVPRSITATVGGTAGSIKAVGVTITGTNYADEVITEDLPAFTADTAGTVEGNKAFKTVTSISIPAMDGAGVTVKVGFGDKLGLPYKLSHNTVLASYLDNVLEATAPTVTVSATAMEGNTAELSSALNGKDVDIYLVV